MSLLGGFSSWLGEHFERFICLKRACGARYETQARQLLSFDVYLREHVPQPPLHREALAEYIRTLDHLSDRGRSNQLTVVWHALAYAGRHHAAVDELPQRPPTAPPWLRLRPPRVLSLAEVRALIAAARRLPPDGSLRPATAATLLGLLCATGLRIGEALGLDVGDVDIRARLLTIRRGKFGKTRVLPLRESTVQAVDRYIRDPARPLGTTPEAPLFVSTRRRRLSHPAAAESLAAACLGAGIPRPRIHDLRHTFAVQRLLDWYASGRDLNAMLPALSTYLGHVSIQSTRTYLAANGLLLQEASSRYETKTTGLDQVLP